MVNPTDKTFSSGMVSYGTYLKLVDIIGIPVMEQFSNGDWSWKSFDEKCDEITRLQKLIDERDVPQTKETPW